MILASKKYVLALVAWAIMIFSMGCELEPSYEEGILDSGEVDQVPMPDSSEPNGKEDLQVDIRKMSLGNKKHPEPLGTNLPKEHSMKDIQKPTKPGEEFNFAFSHVDRELVDHLEVAHELMSRKEKDVAGAILELEKALYDDPSDYDSALMLADIARGSERFELSTDAYMLCTQLDPDSSEPWNGLARLSLSHKQLDQAEQLAKRALHLNPKSSMANNILGRIWLERSHWGKAISYLRKAVELAPENIYFVNNLGFAYLLSRDFQSAVETLEPVSEKPGARAFMINNLGLAYEGMGRVQDATVMFKKAIGISPRYVNAKINLKRIVQVAKRDQAFSPDSEIDQANDQDTDGQPEDLIIGDDDEI